MHSPEDEFVEVEVKDPIGVGEGQKVTFESDSSRMIRVVFLVFWLPLVSAGLLAWVGWSVSAALGLVPALGAAVLGVGGFAGAIALVRRVEGRTEAGAGLTIVGIVSENEVTCGAPEESGTGEDT
jgi:positive regulator of sigma E activity